MSGKFEHEWVWGTLDHLGVWAFGGDGQRPEFQSVSFQVPKHDGVIGWYCYMGPMPEFKDQLGH